MGYEEKYLLRVVAVIQISDQRAKTLQQLTSQSDGSKQRASKSNPLNKSCFLVKIKIVVILMIPMILIIMMIIMQKLKTKQQVLRNLDSAPMKNK